MNDTINLQKGDGIKAAPALHATINVNDPLMAECNNTALQAYLHAMLGFCRPITDKHQEPATINALEGVIGLTEEFGEVVQAIRGANGNYDIEFRNKLKLELGDMLFYLAKVTYFHKLSWAELVEGAVHNTHFIIMREPQAVQFLLDYGYKAITALCGVIKKETFHGKPKTNQGFRLCRDIFFVLTAIAASFDLDLWLIAEDNIAKLTARFGGSTYNPRHYDYVPR